MKRSLDDNNKTEKIVNFQKPKDYEKNIKRSNEEDLKKLNNILDDIFEDDNVNIIINIDTKDKKICINEKSDEKEKNREYKYGDKNLSSLIDSIYDDFMYKDINSLLLYLNKQNLFVDKENWKDQLLNEIAYINALEEDMKKEDELINILETNLAELKLDKIK